MISTRPSGSGYGPGVAEAEPAVVVVEEGQQLGRGVEPGEGVVLGSSGSKSSSSPIS